MNLITYGLLLLLLLLIAMKDLKSREIDTRLTLLLLAGSVPAVALNRELSYTEAYGAGVLMFFLLGAVYFLSKKNLGLGDIKLCSCIAPYLGIEKGFAMLLLAMMLCGVAAALLLAFGKVTRNKELPFAPFTAAAVLMVLWM